MHNIFFADNLSDKKMLFLDHTTINFVSSMDVHDYEL
jgi:hypothetical protein